MSYRGSEEQLVARLSSGLKCRFNSDPVCTVMPSTSANYPQIYRSVIIQCKRTIADLFI